MTQALLERVASVTPTDVAGTFYRHAAPARDAFAGVTLARWGRTFPVIYLGRPEASVVVEAYRHLVEPLDISPAAVQPRVLYTVTVTARRLLDLTVADHKAAVGLTDAQLTSDVDDYDACQAVAEAAYELELHGILAPAATGLGQTLALFAQQVSAAERPVVTAATRWQHLPPDPRLPRLVRDVGDSA